MQEGKGEKKRFRESEKPQEKSTGEELNNVKRAQEGRFVANTRRETKGDRRRRKMLHRSGVGGGQNFPEAKTV